MGRRVTLHQVAQQAGVSRATASMIVSNTGSERFSAQTRQRVRQAAIALNYEPRARKNSSAPVARQTRLLSWIHPRPLNQMDEHRTYDGELLASFIKVAHEEGWHVAVGNGFTEVSDLQPFLDERCRHSVDALVLAGNLEPEILQHVAACGFPAVYISHSAGVFHGMTGVYADNFQGGRLAAEHLIELGHRRFVAIGRRSRGYIRQRIAGFQDAMMHVGMEESALVNCDREWPEAEFEEAMNRAIGEPHRATAAFIASGDDLLTVMAYIKRHHIQVPEQLSLVGYDDSKDSTHMKPALTVAANSREHLAQVAFHRLMEQLKQPNGPAASLMVPTELIMRQSTAKPCE